MNVVGGRGASALLVGLAILSAPSCRSSSTDNDAHAASAYAPAPDPNAPPPRDAVTVKSPWTNQFMQSSVLVAAEVRIEGPSGLLEHLATRADSDYHERREKAVPAGFMQEITLKPGVEDAEIKAWLDKLAVAATKRLIILERPGPVDVVVLAAGDAYWVNHETKEEQRGESLRLVGKVER